MEIKAFKKFLTELDKNNNKHWFDRHREEYQTLRKELISFAEIVHSELITFAPEFVDLNPKKSLFRINRDVRFSPNKLPYKTGMGFKFVLGSKSSDCPGYGLWIDTEGIHISAGTPKLDTKYLSHFRDYFVAKSQTTQAVLQDVVLEGFELSQEYTLKTAPRGYSPEHPMIELLKLQSYRAGKFYPFSSKEMTNEWLIQTTIQSYERLLPFVKLLKIARNFTQN